MRQWAGHDAGLGRWARAGRAGSRLGAGRAGVGRAGRARGAGGWARAGSGTARASQAMGTRACGAGGGRRAGRAAGGAQALGARGALGRVTTWALGARPGRWESGLGARAGLELCTRCTRPVFGLVRLGIFLSQIFWTLFVNPVHEHCSSRNFSKKKNINYFLKILKNEINFDKIFEK